MPKGVDGDDHICCTLIDHTMDLSMIPATSFLINALLQKSYSVYFLKAFSLFIKLSFSDSHSLSLRMLIVVMCIGYECTYIVSICGHVCYLT